ncbi:hypothetical protein, conserved [Babesia bigemina]|uniref:C3H1-type domain-containing protein n=1 Tax=Babesia bigemina TaxID=5866 RepID=A0A061BKC3_BABBI|nr:hypothetical protein, conserved [Babesia bigemina]CDR71373.1 hypothetical protein, conserved [Babesia bigemina]|eukprot:XP_012770323.1 hypothetical protein, conserved [Babesia bigemina]
MGFLLSCLEGSKELLKHYNPQITQIIEHLQSSIGKGLGVSGFADVIGKVKSGLQGYESGMEERIAEVKKPLQTMQESFRYLETYLTDVSKKNLATQLDHVASQASTYMSKSFESLAGMNKLDTISKGKLECHVKSVLQATKNFKEVNDSKQLKKQAAEVDRQLQHQRQRITVAINVGTNLVKQTLKKQFDSVRSSVHDVNDNNSQQFKLLYDAVKAAQGKVNELLQSFNDVYANEITKHIDKLRANMTNITKNSVAKSNLKSEFMRVMETVTEIEVAYQTKLLDIKRDVEAAVSQAVNRLKTVDNAVKSGLSKVRQDIYGNLEGFVQGLVEKVKAAAAQSIPVSDTYPGVKALGSNLTEYLPLFGQQITDVAIGKNEFAQKLEHFMNYLHKMSTRPTMNLDTTTLIGALSIAIDGQIEKVIKDEEEIHFQLQKIMEAYQDETQDPALPNKLRSMIDEIKTPVKDITSSTGAVNTSAIEDYDTSKPLYDAASHVVYSVITSLEDIPACVDAVLEISQNKMASLEEAIAAIKSRIDIVEQALISAESTLRAYIDAAYRAIETSRQKSKQTVEHFQTTLLSTVSSAFSSLTHQVQSLFAKQKQAELAALESVVTQQLKEIDKIIKDDSINGLKGFLSDLQYSITQQFPNGSLNDSTKLPVVAIKLVQFFDPLFEYVIRQLTPKTQMLPSTSDAQSTDPTVTRVRSISTKLNKLLTHLMNNNNRTYNFDYTFETNLDALKQSVRALGASKFGDGAHPDLLNLIKCGMTDFNTQLDYAYVSRYSERTSVDNNSSVYAKIGMTIIPILLTDFKEILANTDDIGDWLNLSLNLRDDNALGSFLQTAGYDVPTSTDVSNGHLKNKQDFCGGEIRDILTKRVTHKLFNTTKHTTYTDGMTLEHEEEDGVLQKLHAFLGQYFKACHITHTKSPRSPCNVFHMLCWLSGLQFNSVFNPLFESIKELFMVPVDSNPNEKTLKPMNAYPKSFLPDDVGSAIHHICSYSYATLTTIIGTGNAFTNYASDMCNNSMRLYYPSRGEECLYMLLDILSRLFPALEFLKKQCGTTSKDYGWADCHYGKDVIQSNWQCNNHPIEKPTSQPTCQANCKPKCRPTSPLMSYLNDCLPGHIPHQLRSIGCKYECNTCSKSRPGMPCITPLGFRGFSGSMKTGQELSDVIKEFLSHEHISSLFCLVQKPPSTLPEHFGFALSLIRHWHYDLEFGGNAVNKPPMQISVENSIEETSMQLYNNSGDLTKTYIDAYGSTSASHVLCKLPHLSNMTNAEPCHKFRKECAPYLASLCENNYKTLATKHSGLYLSWAIYLPWTFHKYLKSLLDEFRQIYCREWGCGRCQNENGCRSGHHGSFENPCHCKSLVSCKGVSPTLYKCGFMFGNLVTLNHGLYPKSCYNFQKTLSSVIHSKYFTDLFDKCDDFLFAIRAPFIWTTLSLWLLSLLYLLHIMVIRLDLLHIKSHLHSPSSHRIAAQSLLAAARVNKLNRVFYLQP